MKQKTITLSGSTRFQKAFEYFQTYFEGLGYKVFTVELFSHSEGVIISQRLSELLSEWHFEKIDKSDELFIIDVGGYIGEATGMEHSYAFGKIPVRKMSEYFPEKDKEFQKIYNLPTQPPAF